MSDLMSSCSSCVDVRNSVTVKCRMTMKEWIHRMKPARLVIVLILSIIYFLVLLAFSHITHALTLLVQCYHMVCNIIALIGSLIMVKVSICTFVERVLDLVIAIPIETTILHMYRVYCWLIDWIRWDALSFNGQYNAVPACPIQLDIMPRFWGDATIRYYGLDDGSGHLINYIVSVTLWWNYSHLVEFT